MPGFLKIDSISGRLKMAVASSRGGDDGPPTYGRCGRFQIGNIRFSPVPNKLLVVNLSPHIPFRLTVERSAYSTMLLYKVWPGGEEDDLLVDALGIRTTAVNALAALLESLRGSPEAATSPLLALVKQNELIQRTLDTQGEPTRGHENDGPDDEDDDDVAQGLVDDEEQFPDDLGDTGLLDDASLNPLLRFTAQTGAMHGTVLLDPANYSKAKGCIERLKLIIKRKDEAASSQVRGVEECTLLLRRTFTKSAVNNELPTSTPLPNSQPPLSS